MCVLTAKEDWTVHPTTGAYYQLNTRSAVTQPQAEASCKQQGASLLSITDPHQQAYVTGQMTRYYILNLCFDKGSIWAMQ